MNRRRVIIGLGTIAFGASGFVASGAFSFGSEGSLGDSWVQVEGTNQAVSFNPAPPATGGNGSTGDGSDDGGNDGDDTGGEEQPDDEQPDEQPEEEPPEEEQPEEAVPEEDPSDDDDTGGSGGDDADTLDTRVQVVVDPDNSGNAVNGTGSARWNGTIFDTDLVLATDAGFFRGVSVEGVSLDAVSTIGRTDTNGYPNGSAAFIIANVGPESGGDGATVRVSAQLFADGEQVSTDQLRFPYRVVDSDGNQTARGTNLLAGTGPRLPDGHVIEVVMVLDTRNGSDDLERIDNLRFSAVGVN